MRVSNIALLFAAPTMASLFFTESKSDRIKSNLQNIGYEVLDSAGVVKDGVIETFDPESLKDWLEAHGVTDAASQTLETAKQHKEWLLEDIKDYAHHSQDFSNALLNKGKDFFASTADDVSAVVFQGWSDSKIKEFLDARGVAVPQGSTRNQLNALAARVKHSLPVNVNGPSGHYWFDGWSREELVKKLEETGESIEGSRKELADRLQKAYVKSYYEGASQGQKAADQISTKFEDIKSATEEYASEASDKIRAKFGEWKEATIDSFNSWSVDDLKEYLQEFGTEVGEAKDKLVEAASDNYHYFVYGEVPPKTFSEKIKKHLSDHFSGLYKHFSDHFSSLHNRFSSTKSSISGYLGKIVGINSVLHNEL